MTAFQLRSATLPVPLQTMCAVMLVRVAQAGRPSLWQTEGACKAFAGRVPVPGPRGDAWPGSKLLHREAAPSREAPSREATLTPSLFHVA